MLERSCDDCKNAQGRHELQGQVASFPCFGPVLPCYCRPAGAAPAGRGAPVSSFPPVAYGQITGAGLCPVACFSPVIYRDLQANRFGSARSSACACSRALSNRPSRRRINAPGSRIPRSAERRWFAVPSGSGQIVREYRKWVAARFRLSAFDGTPAHCRCE